MNRNNRFCIKIALCSLQSWFFTLSFLELQRKELLQEDAVAIVGSRKAGEIALQFTDIIAKKCVSEHKVIVSGFAKGVDKQALDSAIEANGKSIIVLPQGILTFQSGFKKYYGPIVNGDLLVLSSFFPQGWMGCGLGNGKKRVHLRISKRNICG